jgi:hypothetical protein
MPPVSLAGSLRRMGGGGSVQMTVVGTVAKDVGEAHRAVDTTALTFMLINAVNELAARVAVLEKDNARLRAE